MSNQDDLSLVKNFSLEAASIFSDTMAAVGRTIEQQNLGAQEAAELRIQKLAEAAEQAEALARSSAAQAEQLLGSDSKSAKILAEKAVEQAQVRNYLNNRIAQELPDFTEAASRAIDGKVMKVLGEAGGPLADTAQVVNKLVDGDTSGSAGTAYGSILGWLVGAGLLAANVHPAGAAAAGILSGILGEELFDSSPTAQEAVENALADFLDSLDGVVEKVGDFIEDVNDLFQQLSSIFVASPLVLDLDGDGYELSALNGSTVHFDIDANDFAERTGWVGADDGLLVYDRNGNGTIDNGAELFGDRTPLSGGGSASDGFAALAELDVNGDGVIDANDVQFTDLRIWQDINQDGESESSELKTLTEVGIASINLNATSSSQTVNGHSIPLVSTFTRSDGTTGNVGDVFFQVDAVDSRFVGEYELSLEALLLPKARGYGNVADLHVAMSQECSNDRYCALAA